MRSVLATTVIAWTMGTIVAAQGIRHGEVRGTVSDGQGKVVAAATLTATSPALQGARTAATNAEGQYVLAALPPGDYQLTFERRGFASTLR